MSATFGERSPGRRESRRERVVKQQSEGNNSLLAYATFQVNVGAGISDESLRMMRGVAQGDLVKPVAMTSQQQQPATVATKEDTPKVDPPKQGVAKEPEAKASPEMKQPKVIPGGSSEPQDLFSEKTWGDQVREIGSSSHGDPNHYESYSDYIPGGSVAYYLASSNDEGRKELLNRAVEYADPERQKAIEWGRQLAADSPGLSGEEVNNRYAKYLSDRREGLKSQPQTKEPDSQPQQVEQPSQPTDPQPQQASVSDKPTEPPAQPPEPFVSTVKPDAGQKFKDQGPATIPTGTFGADPDDTRKPETLPPGRDQKPPKPTSGPGMDIGDARRNLQRQFQQKQMAKAQAMMGNWYPEQGFGWGEGPLNADNGGVMGEGVTNFARESTTNHELTSATLAVLAARVRMATRALRDASS